MLTIRLQRTGRTNRPEFRLVLIEKRSASKSAAKEVLGSYNPRTKKLSIVDQDRLNHWVTQIKVPLSPSANNLLVSQKIIEGTMVKSFSVPKKVVVEEKKEEPQAEAPTVATEEATVEVATEEETKAE